MTDDLNETELPPDNWMRILHEMDRKRLEMFTINMMGYLSTFPPHDKQTPQEIFDLVYEVGKEDWEMMQQIVKEIETPEHLLFSRRMRVSELAVAWCEEHSARLDPFGIICALSSLEWLDVQKVLRDTNDKEQT